MTASSATNASRPDAVLRYSGLFMLAIGALLLVASALGADGKGWGGVLVLAGASILLPNEEKVAKVGLAVAGAALAVIYLTDVFS